MLSWFSERKASAKKSARKQCEAQEVTSLMVIMPSAGSTENPSSTNIKDYGSSELTVKHHDDDEHSTGSLELYTPLHPNESFDRDSSWNNFSSLASKRFQERGISALAIVAIAVAAMFAIQASHGTHITVTNDPTNHSNKSPVDDFTKFDSKLSRHKPIPFSLLDPVKDLGLNSISHGEATSPPPNIFKGNRTTTLPTSAWYQNLIMNQGEPGSLQRVYTTPLVLDVNGPIPGLRVHPSHVGSSVTVMQLSYEDQNGITIGISSMSSTKPKNSVEKLSNIYSVIATTPLGITLQWDTYPMTSSIVRGMPFTTMHYPIEAFGANGLFPTIKSQVELRDEPIIDGIHVLKCNEDGTSSPALVSYKLRVSYKQSDFTWLFFFSQPVMVKCVSIVLPEPKEPLAGPPGALGPKKTVEIQVVELVDSISTNEQLTIRAILLNNCTVGLNPLYCQGGANDKTHIDEFENAIEKTAPYYPGPASSFQYNVDNENDMANLYFDWNVKNMVNETESSKTNQNALNNSDTSGLLMFALPHHLDRMGTEYKLDLCKPSLIGSMCLVHGATWTLAEPLPPLSFRAPRPPLPLVFRSLVEALKEDIGFRVHGYFSRGAGDTYFSGKLLAKQARILLIAEEVRELCNSDAVEYRTVCSNITLWSKDEMKNSLDSLRAATEIWINGTADTPFVYETAWGGVISCGCNFDSETQECSNQYPDCPSVTDPGLNFGNGFYNDHHFHYGYHINAAATIAHFDPEWGRKHFEQVLMLVRDIANPSKDDHYFPVFRQKDWFQGHSWASGVPLPPYLNGKNQESSSESIAGYESVALFGKVMVEAWAAVGDKTKVIVSKEVRDVGRLLTATEIRSTDRYYHVRHIDESMAIYPRVFRENVVGVMWNMMAQFQTWFGSAPYLAYGIQLLPLTPVSESRDDAKWLREMYKPYADSCNENPNCALEGWSVMQLAMLASVGHPESAINRAKALPSNVFTSAGGNGHSLSNTLWYIATRPDTEPLEVPLSDLIIETTPTTPEDVSFELTNCGCNTSCTDDVLLRDAMGFTCGHRIKWLIHSANRSEFDACTTVGEMEFPMQCGPCNPNRCGGHDAGGATDDFISEHGSGDDSQKCPPCSVEQCQSRLNNCPLFPHVFVCSSGPSKGGCSAHAWDVGPGQCQECCELTTCKSKEPGKTFIEPDVNNGTSTIRDDPECPPCSSEICGGPLNKCNIDHDPYLCTHGASMGGCGSQPWAIEPENCIGCCKLSADCEKS